MEEKSREQLLTEWKKEASIEYDKLNGRLPYLTLTATQQDKKDKYVQGYIRTKLMELDNPRGLEAELN